MIVAHPEIENSQTQTFLQKGAQEMAVTWHHLDTLASLDVTAEQQLLRTADRIIFQFPLYWYAAPASLKQWEDQVLTSNFVYGVTEPPLKNKEFGIVVTTGRPLKDFRHGARENITMDEILLPYRVLAQQAQMQIMPAFIIPQFWYQNETQQMQLLIDYQRYLTQVQPDSLANRQTWFANRLQQFATKLPETDQLMGQLIKDTFEQNKSDLEQLQDTLTLVKQGEDE